MPTSVALSSHFELFIRDQVSSGRYNNVSEVVRAGLRLLEDQERLNELKLASLKAAIQTGLESSDELSAEAVFDRLEEKYRSQIQVKE